jgi:ribose/xylose/arabinose/galactoside ABC-type transport system permease subunit
LLHITQDLSEEESASLDGWLADERFHQLHAVAVGAKVILTANMDLSVGAANGAAGTVAALWAPRRRRWAPVRACTPAPQL